MTYILLKLIKKTLVKTEICQFSQKNKANINKNHTKKKFHRLILTYNHRISGKQVQKHKSFFRRSPQASLGPDFKPKGK